VSEDLDGSDDPYEELETVFDQPILLEDAEIETIEVPEEVEPVRPPEDGMAEKLVAALERMDDVTRRLWARLEALEGEVRGGSERTLEALRRLGERMGAELGMLDKRAINLELTLARLRSVTEAVEAGVRRLPEPRSSTPPPPRVPKTSPTTTEPPAGADVEEPIVPPKPTEPTGPPRLWPGNASDTAQETAEPQETSPDHDGEDAPD
jgi:hypothetical protein